MRKVLTTLLAGTLIASGVLLADGAKENAAIAAAVQVEDAFAQVIEMAKPSVVVITNKQKNDRATSYEMNGIPEEFFDFFGFPFGQDEFREQRTPRSNRSSKNERRQKPEPVGKGSGIIIREDGYILTNYHVIKDADALEVKTLDGTIYNNEKKKDEVVVVGYDEESDLAILRIPEKKNGKHPKLDFADSEKLKVGQWAIAIGAPFDLDYSVTIGCVSQKGRTNMGVSAFDSYIQTDASINPGNSGGPLLDIHGRIIGVNQFIVTGGMSKGSIGLGFAISSNFAKKIADELIENGTIDRPFIGIGMQDIKAGAKDKLGVDYGVLVREVFEDEAADKAGIKVGDIITAINGKPVKDSHEMLMEVIKCKPGDKIKLTVYRDDKSETFTLKAGSRNDFRSDNGKARDTGDGRSENALKRLGLRLREVDEQVFVTDIIDDGAVDEAEDDNEDEIKEGDIILDINRTPVSSIADVKKALDKAKNGRIMLYMQRNSRRGRPYRYLYALKLD